MTAGAPLMRSCASSRADCSCADTAAPGTLPGASACPRCTCTRAAAAAAGTVGSDTAGHADAAPRKLPAVCTTAFGAVGARAACSPELAPEQVPSTCMPPALVPAKGSGTASLRKPAGTAPRPENRGLPGSSTARRADGAARSTSGQPSCCTGSTKGFTAAAGDAAS